MKHLIYSLILVLASTLVSCQDTEEPQSPLFGSWENRSYNDSLGLWSIQTLTFTNDSSVLVENTLRQTETGPKLGYTLIANAWYNFDRDVFTFYYSEALIRSRLEEDALPYSPKEDLSLAILEFLRRPKGVLTFAQDRSRFEFQEDCWALNAEDPCIQPPSAEFFRVD